MFVLPTSKFLLTKPMHMAAEDSGVCQLHSITEDPVSSGHGATSGTQTYTVCYSYMSCV